MKKAKITALLLAAALLAAGCSGREEAAQAGSIPSSRSEASAPEESALEESDLEESAPEQPQLPGESGTPASGQAEAGGSSESGSLEGTAEENARYAETYLQPIVGGAVLTSSFSAGNLQGLGSPILMVAFEDLTGTGQMDAYWAEYGGLFPQKVVEDCLTRYFDVTPEMLREDLLANFYQPEEESYRCPGIGRPSGLPVKAQVDASRLTGGSRLELDYTLFSCYGLKKPASPEEMYPSHAGTVTIQLEGDGSWKYLANASYILEGTAVSEDGLHYRNETLGLAIDLPEDLGAPLVFLTQTTEVFDSSGYRVILSDHKGLSGEGLAVITAMLPGAYERNLAFDGPNYGESFAENSQWVFTVSYSRAPHETGTPEENDFFESTLKPRIRRDFFSWVTVSEPGA